MFVIISNILEHQLKTHRLRKHTAPEEMRFRCERELFKFLNLTYPFFLLNFEYFFSVCDYATVEKSSLQKHIRFRHTKERPYTCDVCGFRWGENDTWGNHFKIAYTMPSNLLLFW